jgi:hypothetical protein
LPNAYQRETQSQSTREWKRKWTRLVNRWFAPYGSNNS